MTSVSKVSSNNTDKAYKKFALYNKNLRELYSDELATKSARQEVLNNFISENYGAIEKIIQRLAHFEHLSTDCEDIRSEVTLACIEKFVADESYDPYFFKNVEAKIKDRLVKVSSCAPVMSRSTIQRQLQAVKSGKKTSVDIPKAVPFDQACMRRSKDKAFDTPVVADEGLRRSYEKGYDTAELRTILSDEEFYLLYSIFGEKTPRTEIAKETGKTMRQIEYATKKALKKCVA